MKQFGINNKKRFTIKFPDGDIFRFGSCDPNDNDAVDIRFESGAFVLVSLGKSGDGEVQDSTPIPDGAVVTNGFYDYEHDGWKTLLEFINQQ